MTTTVNSEFTTRPSLPPLPLEEWEQTKETLHLWVQIIGKVRMATSPPRHHWWHVSPYLDVRWLTTRRLHAADGTSFAGAGLGGWNRRELASTWCPPPSELHDLVGG